MFLQKKVQISLNMLAKKLSRVRRVKPKNDTGQTGHRKNLPGQPGQGCYGSGRVGSGRSQKDHGSGRAGSKIPTKYGSRVAGRPGSAVDPQHPYLMSPLEWIET